MMKKHAICYFGIYQANYSRNRVLMNGLRAHGVEILECNSTRFGLAKYVELFLKHRKLRGRYDAMLVGFPGHPAMPLAWLLTRFSGTTLIFDAFISTYNSNVEDRKNYRAGSLAGLKYWLLDWLSCSLADVVLLDTDAHIQYFVRTFGIAKRKFQRVFVGTDSALFKPQPGRDGESFVVHFHGHFIPLQGVEYIIRAADVLRDKPITFQIVGRGQKYDYIRGLAESMRLNNIVWVPEVPYEGLSGLMGGADVCLGIFGDTLKTQMVIPNKVFEALASARAIITADTPAARELLTAGENVIFCKTANSQSLAEAILKLYDDKTLRDRIAKAGRQLFEDSLIEDKLVGPILPYVQ